MPSITSLVAALSLTAAVLAKTDLTGCTSSDTVAYGGASVIWYVPGTGEICAPLDCGGGRAPPKTTVPGCAAYSGTETYSPSYLTLASTSAPSVASSTMSTATAAVATASGSVVSTYSMAMSSSAMSSPATTAAPVITSMTTYGTAVTLSPSAAANGTLSTATLSASSTPSSALSNDAVTARFGNQLLALAVAGVAAAALI